MRTSIFVFVFSSALQRFRTSPHTSDRSVFRYLLMSFLPTNESCLFCLGDFSVYIHQCSSFILRKKNLSACSSEFTASKTSLLVYDETFATGRFVSNQIDAFRLYRGDFKCQSQKARIISATPSKYMRTAFF